MTKYELMVILKPMLPEDIRAGIESRLKKVISKANGKIISTDVWGRKHLAYKINNQDEGYYIIYKLDINPDKVTGIKTELKLFNDILRYIIVREDNQ